MSGYNSLFHGLTYKAKHTAPARLRQGFGGHFLSHDLMLAKKMVEEEGFEPSNS
jgi:hypothetical protein